MIRMPSNLGANLEAQERRASDLHRLVPADVRQRLSTTIERTRQLISSHPQMTDWEIQSRVDRDRCGYPSKEMVAAFRFAQVGATPKALDHDLSVTFLYWVAAYNALTPTIESYWTPDGRRHMPDLVIYDGNQPRFVIEVKSSVSGPDSTFTASQQAVRYATVVDGPGYLVFLRPPRAELLSNIDQRIVVRTMAEMHADIRQHNPALVAA